MNLKDKIDKLEQDVKALDLHDNKRSVFNYEINKYVSEFLDTLPEKDAFINDFTDSDLIFKEQINPDIGVLPFQARKIAFNLGLKGTAVKDMVKFVNSAYQAYIKSDASLVEINPLIQNSTNNILVVDCKFVIDI